jgi:REP element-mobilizing transposase RayT
VVTDAMLTFTEHTVRGVCTDLNAEMVEFDGKADHVHLLIAYPPALAISVLHQRLKDPTAYAVQREFTGACFAPACADTSGHCLPSVAVDVTLAAAAGAPQHGLPLSGERAHRCDLCC